jgi:hypothetical protein
MPRAKRNNSVHDQQVFIQVVLIASLVLGVALTIVTAILTKALTPGSNFEKALLTGGNLFVFWLIVTSAVRTVERLRRGLPWRALIFTGILVSVLGILCQQLIFWIARQYDAIWATTPGLRVLKFYAMAGLVVSLVALIHLRVRSRAEARIYEALVIAITAGLFFYFMK